ncbi:AMP-binding protein [Nocardia sp. NPDC050793]|uniref:AMP-binding protein n=1 Tax=Nocardia sp. NPDC050793 TaxID=3155159 RepID=UPI0033FB9A1A
MTILELFDRTVAMAPEATAVSAAGRATSYAELSLLVNRMANRLRERGGTPESVVGVVLGGSLEAVVTVLAVWRAGAAFVPVDPAYPAARVRHILTDAGAEVVVTEENWADLAAEGAALAEPRVFPANLAYLIYTSGSTGAPKGVMVSFGALANYLDRLRGVLALEGPVSALAHSSLAFDFSYASLLLPLITGGRLTIADRDTEVGELVDLMRKTDLDLVRLTPSHIEAMASASGDPRERTGPRAFLVGGETLRAHHVATLRRLFPATSVYNHYGPTEAVIGRTVFAVDEGQEFRLDRYGSHDAIPIGRAFA